MQVMKYAYQESERKATFSYCTSSTGKSTASKTGSASAEKETPTRLDSNKSSESKRSRSVQKLTSMKLPDIQNWMPDEVRRLEDGFKLYGQNYKAVANHVRTKSYQSVYPQIKKMVQEQELMANSRKGYRPVVQKSKKAKPSEVINVSEDVK